MALPIIFYVLFSALLFILGAFCLATRRSLIKQIIGLEILVNAAHLNFVALATGSGGGVDPYAQAFIVLSLGLGAAVVALALLLSVQVYRTYRTLDVAKLKRLRR